MRLQKKIDSIGGIAIHNFNIAAEFQEKIDVTD